MLLSLTGLLLGDMLVSESSTAALLLLFLPVYQGVLLVMTALAALVTHRLRRGPSAPQEPSQA